MYYFDIISKKRKDGFASLLRVVLSMLELPYGLIVWIRNFMYDRGLCKIKKLPVPVISIGNLTVGGTGKTPCVAWLAQKYLDAGLFPAIVSRGYHADETGWNDEAKELKLLLPEVPQAFSKNRFMVAQQLLNRFSGENGTRKIDVILLDDGFQHRKLFRNKNILLVDASNPFGYNRLIPRGLLREPISAIKRADLVLLTRANRIDLEKKCNLKDYVRRFAPSADWAEMSFYPKDLFFLSGQRKNIDAISGQPVFVFCGLGNPDGFMQTVRDCGAVIVQSLIFPDHHSFSNNDRSRIYSLATQLAVSLIVCSLKDFVKIQSWQLKNIDLCAIVIGADISEEC